jgi:D-aminopeptidase
MGDVRSINPVVGETNDGYALNAIRQRPITPADVRTALAEASTDVAEGSVGAGTGTVAFGWKGGIGTSSRVAAGDSGYTVGVLVQSNYGGDLHILGLPVGRALGRRGVRQHNRDNPPDARGSIMIIVATDAPLSDRNLRRLGARALLGVGRTGSAMDNGSGDYVIAFSTSDQVRRLHGQVRRSVNELANDATSPLFQAVVEATEEAVYNSLFMATTMRSRQGTVEALPIGEVLEFLRGHRVLAVPKRAPAP